MSFFSMREFLRHEWEWQTTSDATELNFMQVSDTVTTNDTPWQMFYFFPIQKKKKNTAKKQNKCSSFIKTIFVL